MSDRDIIGKVFGRGRILRGFALLLVSLSLSHAAALREVPAGDIDALFAPWNKAGSPGAALAVFHDGKIVYERGYGRANLERDISISGETVFYVGSVSKQFAAAAITLLVGRGVLDLDDDVRKFVPELPDYGDRITIRHLLHHTSGLRDYLALREIAGEPADGTFGDAYVLALLGRQKALNFRPGSEHLYSNSGYFLLSQIVRRTTGQTLRQFAAENIFGPLGMKTAQFRDDHTAAIANRADGYEPRPGGSYRINNPNFDVVGAGGVFMTVRDFLAWDENFYAPKVGDREWIALLETPGKLNDGKALAYAFGLVVGEYRGLRIVEHAGAYGGFRAHVLRFPAHHFSVVCFSNLLTMVPGQLARQVATLYLRDVMTMLVTPPPATAATGRTAAPAGTSPAAFGDFTGEYFSSELDVAFRILNTPAGLAVERRQRAAMPIQPEGADKFRAGSIQLAFSRDAGGKVNAFALEMGRVRGLVFERR